MRNTSPGAVDPGARLRAALRCTSCGYPSTGLGMREFPRHPGYPGTLCLPLRYALHRPTMRFPHWNDPRVISKANGAVCARIWPRTAPIRAQMGPLPLNPFSHPQLKAYPHARSVNGDAVRRVASALRVTAAMRAGRIEGIGTGNIKSSALWAGSKPGLRPASNREQAFSQDH